MENQEQQKLKGIVWEAPEFIHYPKTLTWFIVLAVLGLLLSGYFFWNRDFFTGTFFILLLGVALAFGRMKPRAIKIKIDHNGVTFNRTRFPYANLRSFWIVYEPESRTLNLETTAYLNRFLTLQLGSQNPIIVREFLKDYLPEDLERGEQLADTVARKLKF